MTPEQTDTMYYFDVASLPNRAVDLLEALEEADIVRVVHHCVTLNVVKANRIKSLRENKALTPRRLEIIECLANGLNYKETAHKLGISRHSVKSTLSRLYEELDIHSMTKLSVMCAQEGLVRLWHEED